MNRSLRILACFALGGLVATCCYAVDAAAQTPRASLIDERSDRMFTMIERDLATRTGMVDVEVVELDLFNGDYATVPGTSTFCGLVRYNGAPEVPFVVRSAPAPIIQVAIRWNVPQERAVWINAGCNRDGSIFMTRPASMFR